MKKQIVILAEKKLDPVLSKMAVIAIRYLQDQIVAVIDSTYAGKTVGEVLGTAFCDGAAIFDHFEINNFYSIFL